MIVLRYKFARPCALLYSRHIGGNSLHRIANIERDFQQTLTHCVRADYELLKNDPFLRKLIGPAMRIIAPLL